MTNSNLSKLYSAKAALWSIRIIVFVLFLLVPINFYIRNYMNIVVSLEGFIMGGLIGILIITTHNLRNIEK